MVDEHILKTIKEYFPVCSREETIALYTTNLDLQNSFTETKLRTMRWLFIKTYATYVSNHDKCDSYEVFHQLVRILIDNGWNSQDAVEKLRLRFGP